MRALRLLAAASLAIALTTVAPSARAAGCALSGGILSIPVGDDGSVVLVNDGSSIDVQGLTGCSTPIAQITGGIAIDGTSGDNTVEVRLHPTVAYPVIALGLLGGSDALNVVGSSSGDTLTLVNRFSGGGQNTVTTVDGGTGDDVISALGWSKGARLLGGSGDDTLVGSVFADSIDGGSGDDTIAGRAGADALEGGLGTDDTVDYAASPSGVTVTVNGPASVNSGGDATGDALSGIEGVIGSSGGDTLLGDAGANSLIGNAGDDLLVGEAGGDLLAGGTGIDTVSYGASPSAVQVSLGLGATGGDASGDQLVGVENLVGSVFADRLSGDGLANRLDGGPGSDTLLAGAGNDLLIGGGGNDILDGGNGSDTVTFAGRGRQVVLDLTAGRATGDGADTLRGVENAIGGSGADRLVGDARANVLTGGGGSDAISGGGGNDRLLGGSGSDQLLGGPGADYLDGGKGLDVCDGEADLDTYKACDGTGKP